MFNPEEIGRNAESVLYTAYHEGVKAAYRVLANSVEEYLSEHPELYKIENLDVPENFKPLKDYERTLKVQRLALRLALRTAEMGERKVAAGLGLPIHAGGGSLPVAQALPA